MYTIYITEIAYDATCASGEPATQCADSLAECRNEGGLKCLCKAANYKGTSICEVSKFDNKLCILYLQITLIDVIPPNTDHRKCVHIKIYNMYHIKL